MVLNVISRAGQVLYVYNYPQNGFTSGLANYWPFCGSTKDIVGGMDMTIQLNGVLSADRFNNPNCAIQFNNGYGSVPAGNYFNSTSGFTYMTWIYILNPVSYGYWRIS